MLTKPAKNRIVSDACKIVLFSHPLSDLRIGYRKFTIGKQGLVGLLIQLKLLVLAQKLQHLFNNFEHFIFYLVKNKMIIPAKSQNTGIFKIN